MKKEISDCTIRELCKLFNVVGRTNRLIITENGLLVQKGGMDIQFLHTDKLKFEDDNDAKDNAN